MAISRISSSATAASSASVSVAEGDIIIVFAYNAGGVTVPSLPLGWTNINSGTNVGGGTNRSYRSGYRAAGVSGLSSTGTWTDATNIAWIVLRGADPSVPIGNSATDSKNNAATSVTYPAVTRTADVTGQWFIGMAGRATAAAQLSTAPSGMTNVASNPATPHVAVHSTESAPGANWASGDVSGFSASSKFSSIVIEVLPPHMTVTASASDSFLDSHSGTLSAAQDGSNIVLAPYGDSNPNQVIVGQWDGGAGDTTVTEGFLEFDLTGLIASGDTIDSAVIRTTRADFNAPVSDPGPIEFRLYDFGADVDTGDFVTRAGLAAATLVASGSPGSLITTPLDTAFDFAVSSPSSITKNGKTRMVVASERQRTSVAPALGGAAETYDFYASENATVGKRPQLVINYTRAPTSLGALVLTPVLSGTGTVQDTRTGAGEMTLTPSASGAGGVPTKGSGLIMLSPTLAGAGQLNRTSGAGDLTLYHSLAGAGVQKHAQTTAAVSLVPSFSGLGEVGPAPTPWSPPGVSAGTVTIKLLSSTAFFDFTPPDA